MRLQILTATEQSVLPLSLPEHTAAAGAQHGLLAAPGVRGVLCWQLIWLCVCCRLARVSGLHLICCRLVHSLHVQQLTRHSAASAACGCLRKPLRYAAVKVCMAQSNANQFIAPGCGQLRTSIMVSSRRAKSRGRWLFGRWALRRSCTTGQARCRRSGVATVGDSLYKPARWSAIASTSNRKLPGTHQVNGLHGVNTAR